MPVPSVDTCKPHISFICLARDFMTDFCCNDGSDDWPRFDALRNFRCCARSCFCWTLVTKLACVFVPAPNSKDQCYCKTAWIGAILIFPLSLLFTLAWTIILTVTVGLVELPISLVRCCMGRRPLCEIQLVHRVDMGRLPTFRFFSLLGQAWVFPYRPWQCSDGCAGDRSIDLESGAVPYLKERNRTRIPIINSADAPPMGYTYLPAQPR
jgi:hypothetical protein